MDVVVSPGAYERFAPVIAAPGTRYWHVGDDRVLVGAGGAPGAELLPAPEPGPAAAWLSTDVLYTPDGRRLLRWLADAPSLRWVQSGFAGLDLPVLRPLAERGVRITTSHVNAVPIAEYVLGAVLRAFQRPEQWEAARVRREWTHREFREVAGTRWLVVGLGAIGQEVARRARALGAEVDGVRRTPRGDEPVDRVLAPDALRRAVEDHDVVVLALPAGPSTRHLVDADLLARMRPDAVLVNVARGSLVDEQALVEALDRGRPGLAILDVFETEPLPSTSPLWDHDRVVVTPHSCSGGTGRHERNAHLFRANLDAFLAGRPLQHEVRPEDVLAVVASSDVPSQFSP